MEPQRCVHALVRKQGPIRRALSFWSRWPQPSLSLNAGGYGSLLSQGRRKRIRQTAKPSLRAERSNPSRGIASQRVARMRLRHSPVVPAKAGTHTPCPLVLVAVATTFFLIERRWLWALLSQGRRKRVRQTAKPSLRAKRSNPSRGKESMDCFVASLLAMTSLQFQIRLRPRDAKRPSRCIYLSPKRGRGERRVPAAPAASCALCIGRIAHE